MDIKITSELEAEEAVVAELSLLGITYLSRLFPCEILQPRPVQTLLADLVRQPSSRVRSAVIALLLEHPDFADKVPAALRNLPEKDQITLKLFYTAAVYLQHLHFDDLAAFQGNRFSLLPDYFGDELGLTPEVDFKACLINLGKRHQVLSGSYVNWSGTYYQVFHHFWKHKGRGL